VCFDTSWYFTNRGFKAICFEKNDYYYDDLGAPSMWFQLGIVTPLHGAAPLERPPLGGEGYQRDGASSRFTHFDYFH